MDTNQTTNGLARATYETLELPNEADGNLERANVMDGLFATARAIERLAEATQTKARG